MRAIVLFCAEDMELWDYMLPLKVSIYLLIEPDLLADFTEKHESVTFFSPAFCYELSCNALISWSLPTTKTDTDDLTYNFVINADLSF